MRYIGGKTQLLGEIGQVMKDIAPDAHTVIDAFAGSGVVTNYLKTHGYDVISNDLLFFSYALTRGTAQVSKEPTFNGLKEQGIKDPYEYLNNLTTEDVGISDKYCFILQNYSPAGDDGRMYLTPENARKADWIRSTLEIWIMSGLITETEYFVLLASLIVAVSEVSNIAGVYGAYLKTWERRAKFTLTLKKNVFAKSKHHVECHNLDVSQLVKNYKADILYADSPYNSREYITNYHVLETVARGDTPELHGKVGMRPYRDNTSDFCSRKRAGAAFEQMIREADVKYIVISYNSEGNLSTEELTALCMKYAVPGTFGLKEIPYRRYKNKAGQQNLVNEQIYYFEKISGVCSKGLRLPSASIVKEILKAQRAERRREKELRKKGNTEENLLKKKTHILHGETNGTAENTAIKHIAVALQTSDVPESVLPKHIASRHFHKSPMNYTGGKFRILPQLAECFPDEINTMVDLFCGGGDVCANIPAKKVYANDINAQVIDVYRRFQKMDADALLSEIDGRIKRWELTKTNKDGFLRLREFYNNGDKDPIDLFVLTCFAFNYQIRFNRKLEYNTPFGKARSCFNAKIRENLVAFHEDIKDVQFTTMDFEQYDLSGLRSGDFVYADPPYLISSGPYNDQGRLHRQWSKDDDQKLFQMLDNVNSQGAAFALSNVLCHKSQVNEDLIDWSKKYNVHHINCSYNESSYRNVGNKDITDEVLITNY